MQKLHQNAALVVKHTYIYVDIYVDIFVEQGQVACSKQHREKRTSDMYEIIIKHELCMECK